MNPGAEQVMFWILGPLALLGAVGMVFARVAVHSALWLVLTMLSLGGIYILNEAEFLGFAQMIVYTGAIMMLFLFVLMLTGRDAGDSVIELLRGQKVAATILGIGLVALLVSGMLRALQGTTSVGLTQSLAQRGPIGSIAASIFTDYLFPFELTSALLITAALGAMVLAHIEHGPGERRSQRQRVLARMRSDRMSPLPGPGVFATSSSNATPALLPDGSIAPDSVSVLVEQSESQRVARTYAAGTLLRELESGEHPRRPGDSDPDDGGPDGGPAGGHPVVDMPVVTPGQGLDGEGARR